MIQAITLFGLSVAVLSIGCTTPTSVMRKIRPLAAFDLDCPEEQIDLKLISGEAYNGTYGAIGCGNRVRYDTRCSDMGSRCTINAAVTAQKQTVAD